MIDHVWCDIRRGFYLWVYLTAENPEVMGYASSIPLYTTLQAGILRDQSDQE
jgi:hypothetical protein